MYLVEKKQVLKQMINFLISESDLCLRQREEGYEHICTLREITIDNWISVYHNNGGSMRGEGLSLSHSQDIMCEK